MARGLSWLIRALPLIAVCGAATSSFAQGVSSFPAPVDAEEQATAVELRDLIADTTPTIAQVDALLAKLPKPTPLRGFVQLFRARMLMDGGKHPEARVAAEQAVRLSPGNPSVRVLAAEVLTFTGAPRQAAEYWLEAATLEPEVARTSDSYVVDAMVGRLRDAGLFDLVAAVQTRRDELGITDSSAPSRSASAFERLRATYQRAGADAARALIPNVLDPRQLAGMYIDSSYRSLWPGIEAWAGPGFIPMHRRYLEELRRARWARQDYESATDYARALAETQTYQPIVDLFLPRLSGDKLDLSDYQVTFLAPVVARALAATGRQVEGIALLRSVQRGVPADQPLALNLSAALVNLAFFAQDWAGVERDVDRWIFLAKEAGPGVNRSAMLQMKARRACALKKLGRETEFLRLAADVVGEETRSPASADTLYACTGDLAAERRLILQELASPLDRRTWALSIVQPSRNEGWSAEGRSEFAFRQRLKADPAIVAAIAKYGRILSYSVAEALPPGFDPMLPPPSPPAGPGSV